MAPDTKINRAPSHSPSHNSGRHGEHTNEDLKKVQGMAGTKEAYNEAFGLENAQETTGRVSEVLGENASENTSDAGSSTKGDNAKQVKTTAQIKAELLKKLPSEAVLVKQIRKEIESEINILHNKAMKMLRSPAKVDYFEFANALRKIRELKGILSTLLKASVDSLKSLWLKYVHGVV